MPRGWKAWWKRMTIDDLVRRAARYDRNLARDIDDYLRGRQYGLVYEASKPEWVRLWDKPVAVGDFVNVLPPRGTREDTGADGNPSEVTWLVTGIEDGRASLARPGHDGEHVTADVSDLVATARFDQPIYAGLRETGRVERGGHRPYQVVINGENFHALQALMYCYEGKVDCIYIDPPYNTGAKDWKYNNDYVDGTDVYRHSKWLTFMEDRLRLAKRLLNPKDSVLICTIDERECNRLGLLLEKVFPAARLQMISDCINPKGVSQKNGFRRSDEYIYFVMTGSAAPSALSLGNEWSASAKKALKKKKATTVKLGWTSMMRRGSHSHRTERPGLYYPIYANSNTHMIVQIGEVLQDGVSRGPDIDGLVQILPIRTDGSEGCWQVEPGELRSRISQGRVRLGRRTSYGFVVNYLPDGEYDKVINGIFKVTGHAADGSIIAEPSNQENMSVAPTQWKIASHNSTEYGASFIPSLINRPFPYPKSLYAVEDCLRFFVANKPDALVVDFFAGSGTTAHAVMRLNHQDGGRRRCVCITNNEVSANEQAALTARGLRQGDPEWEARGICEYVTKPRITAAITGETPDGDPISGDYKFTDEFPMSDGFEENAVFFDLTYLEPTAVDADLAFDDIAPLLWMRSGCLGPILTHADGYAIGETYAVLFDYDQVRAFVSAVRAREGVSHVFIVTDVDSQYRSMCRQFGGCDVVRLYQSYLRSFEINTEA